MFFYTHHMTFLFWGYQKEKFMWSVQFLLSQVNKLKSRVYSPYCLKFEGHSNFCITTVLYEPTCVYLFHSLWEPLHLFDHHQLLNLSQGDQTKIKYCCKWRLPQMEDDKFETYAEGNKSKLKTPCYEVNLKIKAEYLCNHLFDLSQLLK